MDAFVGRLPGKSTYFSLPFSSIIFTIIGNREVKAVNAALSYSVAVKELLPMLIFILLPVGFVWWVLADVVVFLEQEA